MKKDGLLFVNIFDNIQKPFMVSLTSPIIERRRELREMEYILHSIREFAIFGLYSILNPENKS